jgi:hypothetical protein
VSTEHFNIQILENAIKHETTWIPLDEVSFLEKSEIKKDFLSVLAKSFVWTMLCNFIFWKGFEYISNLEPSSSVDLNYFIELFNIIQSEKTTMFSLRALTIICLFIYIFANSWTTEKVLRIFSRSGYGIVISQKQYLLTLSRNKDAAEELFVKILDAKQAYLNSISIISAKWLTARQELQKVQDKFDELEK